jgi:hypothetical protein
MFRPRFELSFAQIRVKIFTATSARSMCSEVCEDLKQEDLIVVLFGDEI